MKPVMSSNGVNTSGPGKKIERKKWKRKDKY